MLKAQDILILIRLLLAQKRGEVGGYQSLSVWTGVSLSECHAAVGRLARAGLVQSDLAGSSAGFSWVVSASLSREFLEHALKFIFPLQVGAEQRGILTGTQVPGVNEKPAGVIESEKWVWPSAVGETRGMAVIPIYRSVPKAALQDADLHQAMAALDLARSSQARLRRLGLEWLQTRLLR